MNASYRHMMGENRCATRRDQPGVCTFAIGCLEAWSAFRTMVSGTHVAGASEDAGMPRTHAHKLKRVHGVWATFLHERAPTLCLLG